MKPTQIRLAAVYAALREFPPFSDWGLPKTCEIYFVVNKDPTVFGTYLLEGRGAKNPPRHHISISRRNVGQFSTLYRTMAHEMVHLHQGVRKTFSRAHHNPEFQRLAADVCRAFGWDVRAF